MNLVKMQYGQIETTCSEDNERKFVMGWVPSNYKHSIMRHIACHSCGTTYCVQLNKCPNCGTHNWQIEKA